MRYRHTLTYIVLFVALLLGFVLSLLIGPAVSLSASLAALTGEGGETIGLILGEIRLPRALLAVIIGFALGMAGAAMQGFLRNPLAEPGVVGISASAAFAAVVVLHNGQIRLERYNLDFTDQGRWTSFSVAKSFTSTLVGAAIKDGFIDSIDDPVSKYIPGLKGSAYDDVSVEQLLTMSSGVAWNEDYEDPNSDVARFNNHVADDGLSNLVSYMKDLPRAHEPGTVWNYSTGETNMIGVLVSNAINRPLADYLSEKVWQPLGMQQDATWLINPDGSEISGCCIQAATRDFARFGQFFLDGAKVNGESIVPEGWIANATTARMRYGEPGQGYGYQWWTFDDGAYTAYGIFGQSIFIDPSKNLVIATNSNWRSATGRRDGERELRAAFHNAVRASITN